MSFQELLAQALKKISNHSVRITECAKLPLSLLQRIYPDIDLYKVDADPREDSELYMEQLTNVLWEHTVKEVAQFRVCIIPLFDIDLPMSGAYARKRRRGEPRTGGKPYKFPSMDAVVDFRETIHGEQTGGHEYVFSGSVGDLSEVPDDCSMFHCVIYDSISLRILYRENMTMHNLIKKVNRNGMCRLMSTDPSKVTQYEDDSGFTLSVRQFIYEDEIVDIFKTPTESNGKMVGDEFVVPFPSDTV